MIKVSLSWLTDFTKAIDELDKFQFGGDAFQFWVALVDIRDRLDGMYLYSVYAPHLQVSSSQASELKRILEDAIENMRGKEGQLTPLDTVSTIGNVKTFRTVFASELGVMPTYLVIPKGGYDVRMLAETGAALFPERLLEKVPNVADDIEQAGRALAFDLPTACGFHVFRVLETAVRIYWDHISSGADRPKLQTIGSFAEELRKEKLGEAKIWETLAQISKLHRNPLIHPEAILSTEEAIETIGISRSALGSMIRVLPDLEI